MRDPLDISKADNSPLPSLAAPCSWFLFIFSLILAQSGRPSRERIEKVLSEKIYI